MGTGERRILSRCLSQMPQSSIARLFSKGKGELDPPKLEEYAERSDLQSFEALMAHI